MTPQQIIQEIEKLTPENIHNWYLEAAKELNPESYNPNAQKSYEDLTEEQKFIDKYIINKVNQVVLSLLKSLREGIPEDDHWANTDFSMGVEAGRNQERQAHRNRIDEIIKLLDNKE